jgi:hypothetical protein
VADMMVFADADEFEARLAGEMDDEGRTITLEVTRARATALVALGVKKEGGA